MRADVVLGRAQRDRPAAGALPSASSESPGTQRRITVLLSSRPSAVAATAGRRARRTRRRRPPGPPCCWPAGCSESGAATMAQVTRSVSPAAQTGNGPVDIRPTQFAWRGEVLLLGLAHVEVAVAHDLVLARLQDRRVAALVVPVVLARHAAEAPQVVGDRRRARLAAQARARCPAGGSRSSWWPARPRRRRRARRPSRSRGRRRRCTRRRHLALGAPAPRSGRRSSSSAPARWGRRDRLLGVAHGGVDPEAQVDVAQLGAARC